MSKLGTQPNDLIKIHPASFQLFSDCKIVGNCFCDKIPKFLRVIKFAEMAQFVNDDVVAKFLGQQRYLIVEVKIAFA